MVSVADEDDEEAYGVKREGKEYGWKEYAGRRTRIACEFFFHKYTLWRARLQHPPQPWAGRTGSGARYQVMVEVAGGVGRVRWWGVVISSDGRLMMTVLMMTVVVRLGLG
jgi:hypothetical protein